MNLIRVLVAISVASVLASYRELLARAGCEVRTATDSLDCVAKLCGFRPDVLALDRGLPSCGSDGVLAVLEEKSSVP
jgi:CheY-like chemotaxis protein